MTDPLTRWSLWYVQADIITLSSRLTLWRPTTSSCAILFACLSCFNAYSHLNSCFATAVPSAALATSGSTSSVPSWEDPIRAPVLPPTRPSLTSTPASGRVSNSPATRFRLHRRPSRQAESSHPCQRERTDALCTASRSRSTVSAHFDSPFYKVQLTDSCSLVSLFLP